MLKRLLLPLGLLLSLLTPIVHATSSASASAYATKFATSCNASFFQGGTPPAAISKGAPKGGLICQSFYAISYSTTLRNPLWTSYQLTKAMADGGTSIDRFEGDFQRHPDIDDIDEGDHDDYTHSGFARGHLTPADDAIDMLRQEETFFVANIVPQVGSFNSTDWARLEASVHRLAQLDGRVFVVTGATFPASPRRIPRGPSGRIAVPNRMYKAIFVPSTGIAIGYLATNRHPTRCRIVSIAALTRETGVDPFPSLPVATKATRPQFTLPRGMRRNGQLVRLPNCRAA